MPQAPFDAGLLVGGLPRRALIAAPVFLFCAVNGADAEPGGVPAAKPGDFDFLTGEWRIDNHRLRPGETAWDRFPGEASVYTILGGAGSVEDLRIPARDFAGMGLRLLDRARGVWVDYFVNAKSGALGAGGQEGRFVQGVGTFEAADKDGETPILVRGVWDEITPQTCRWRQMVSRDGGKMFAENWIMRWTRA